MQDSVSGFDKIRCLDAPLGDRLAAYDAHLKAKNSEIAKVYASLIERLEAAGAGKKAPKVGSRLPDFMLPDSGGRLHHLAKLAEGGPVVVSFNRGHWCSFCRLEMLALGEIHPDIIRRGASLVSVMPECGDQAGALAQNLDLPFPVLTDIDNGYALTCGLMVALGAAVREAFLRGGTDLTAYQRNEGWFVPIPATFVIGPERRILGRFVDPDFTRRMAPDDILACLANAEQGVSRGTS